MPTDIISPVATWSRRLCLLLMLAYPLLLLAALTTHATWLSAAAALVLLSLLLWPGLSQGNRGAWLGWGVAVLVGGLLALYGHGDLALMLIPIGINGAVAWLFGRTLVPGRKPLIARAIAAFEGDARLALPGVARYARGLTWAWTVFLGAQSLLLLVGAICAVPAGALHKLGLNSPWPIAQDSVTWYGHLGCFLVLAGFFAIEFAYRQWHLRHLPHPSAKEFFYKVAKNWRQVMHDGE